jgi:superkiller protein 3
LDDSINAYHKFILLNPENADAYINIGNALQNQFKFDQAIRAYNKAISLNPNSAQAYYNLGQTQVVICLCRIRI